VNPLELITELMPTEPFFVLGITLAEVYKGRNIGICGAIATG